MLKPLLVLLYPTRLEHLLFVFMVPSSDPQTQHQRFCSATCKASPTSGAWDGEDRPEGAVGNFSSPMLLRQVTHGSVPGAQTATCPPALSGSPELVRGDQTQLHLSFALKG